jgi:hypothetical protein
VPVLSAWRKKATNQPRTRRGGSWLAPRCVEGLRPQTSRDSNPGGSQGHIRRVGGLVRLGRRLTPAKQGGGRS